MNHSVTWTDAELFNRLAALGQTELVVALRMLADKPGTDLLVASAGVVSDDAEAARQVRSFVVRHGGRVVVADQPESGAR